MIASALGKTPLVNNGDKAGNRAGNEKPKASCPSGRRLRANEQVAARKNAPCSKSTGNPICWGYNAHDGCHNAECKHVHEKMKQTGVHWGVLMQLARRGGMSGLPIILPGKVDGYVQAIRDKNVPFGPRTGDSNSSFANAGEIRESMAVGTCLYSGKMEVDVGDANHAGFSADELKHASKPNVPDGICTPIGIPIKSLPLNSCESEVIEFPDVLGQVPDDFQLFDCAEEEEPLRVLLNPNGDWVNPVMETRYPAQIPYVSSEFDHYVENFWTALQIPAPQRFIPFVRHTVKKNANFDFRPSFLEAFETLVEFGPIRDGNDARSFLGGLGDLPTQRAGRRCNRTIISDKPMVLGHCKTQELAISPLRFDVVDYGDLVPMSEELQRIIGPARKWGKNQCVLLHLAAALVRSETSSNRPPPPESRVKMVARGLRLTEEKQAESLSNLIGRLSSA